ncbi:hypothetical protein FHG87_017442 [Trinorchestia longiramus]|nr:hypothetical protein FHG87_017442 [Trinorchestia longiramus]
MFGMNVMAWNGGDLEKLKVLQNKVRRLARGAPKWTAMKVIRGRVNHVGSGIRTRVFPLASRFAHQSTKLVVYDGSFGSQLMFAVRCKALSVNRRTLRWNEGKTRLCLQCNRGVEEIVEHLVFGYCKYIHERESLMDVVHYQYGENQWNIRCVEGYSGMRYLVGLDEECNMTVVDDTKCFLVHS